MTTTRDLWTTGIGTASAWLAAGLCIGQRRWLIGAVALTLAVASTFVLLSEHRKYVMEQLLRRRSLR